MFLDTARVNLCASLLMVGIGRPGSFAKLVSLCSAVAEFFDGHCGGFATQHFKPHRGLEIAQIQLDMPTTFEQAFQLCLGRTICAAQCRYLRISAHRDRLFR